MQILEWTRRITLAALTASACSTVVAAPVAINFDGTGAPCIFDQTTPLTTAYAAQGVVFSSNAPDVGSILNQCGNFGFNARSGTDFLAYNAGSGLDIITLTFSQVVSSISIYAANFNNVPVTLTAFDTNNLVVATTTLVASSQFQQLALTASGIASARLTSTLYGAYDDLMFNAAPNRVPEPASVALIGLGLAGIVTMRRRRSI